MSDKRNHNRVDTCIHNRSAMHHCPVCDTGERHNERIPLELDAPRAQHMPEPWEYEATDVRSPYPFVVKAGDLVIARITDEGDAGVPEANARLTTAAPDGYAAACTAYSFLLGLPSDETRIGAQGLMCELRDYIASAIGKSAEDIQNEYELRAITKATGGE